MVKHLIATKCFKTLNWLISCLSNSFKLSYFPEVHKIPIIVDQSLFYSLTKLPSQGVPFEGTLVNDWKTDYSSHDARIMVYKTMLT